MSLRDLSLGRRHLPVIRAAEAAECGLACVAMIGSYHGHNLDLNTLRQRFSLSLHGATLRGLMELGGQLSLAPRALRVGLNALDKVQTPAIIHWDLNHFVVLKSVRGNRVTIHDPARGARTMRLDEVLRGISAAWCWNSARWRASGRSRRKAGCACRICGHGSADWGPWRRRSCCCLSCSSW